jgi:hypothetical protein
MKPVAAVKDDPLPDSLQRYKVEIDALNASSVEDEDELNAWVDRANALLDEALEHPIVSTEGALAMLTVAFNEPELIFNSEGVKRRCRDATAYLAKQAAA